MKIVRRYEEGRVLVQIVASLDEDCSGLLAQTGALESMIGREVEKRRRSSRPLRLNLSLTDGEREWLTETYGGISRGVSSLVCGARECDSIPGGWVRKRGCGGRAVHVQLSGKGTEMVRRAMQVCNCTAQNWVYWMIERGFGDWLLLG